MVLIIGNWALGIGNWAWGIVYFSCLAHLPYLHSLLFVNKEALAQPAAGIAAKTAPSQITLLNG